jgi:hypothetical protein
MRPQCIHQPRALANQPLAATVQQHSGLLPDRHRHKPHRRPHNRLADRRSVRRVFAPAIPGRGFFLPAAEKLSARPRQRWLQSGDGRRRKEKEARLIGLPLLSPGLGRGFFFGPSLRRHTDPQVCSRLWSQSSMPRPVPLWSGLLFCVGTPPDWVPWIHGPRRSSRLNAAYSGAAESRRPLAENWRGSR